MPATLHVLDVSHETGTRYRLRVVLDGGRIDAIAWPDVLWSAGDLGGHVSAEWLASSAARGRKRGEPAFSLVDARVIAGLVNDLARTARGEKPLLPYPPRAWTPQHRALSGRYRAALDLIGRLAGHVEEVGVTQWAVEDLETASAFEGAACFACGCTELLPCNPPCGWVTSDLCTACYEADPRLLDAFRDDPSADDSSADGAA